MSELTLLDQIINWNIGADANITFSSVNWLGCNYLGNKRLRPKNNENNKY